MKAVIFAGGVGTRMWPLSRKQTPKQFEKIVGDKSTLQLAIERLRPEFNFSDIYISTGKQYERLIEKQIPELPRQNVIGEPEMRDVGPAVGYVATILAKADPDAPFAILWSDHLIANVSVFKQVLQAAGHYLSSHPDKIVFIGQKARFANQNLGWIEHGAVLETINDFSVHRFNSWHYRPPLDKAYQYFKNNHYSWNPGYFVATPKFILQQYQRFMPDMYQTLIKLQKDPASLSRIYPKMEKISFDNAILERLEPEKAVVLTTDMGWSDIGAWEALKEALQTNREDNITHGKTYLHQTKDSLVYNYTNKLVATIDLDGMLVIATDDVILVCPQQSVPEIKKLVESFAATANEKYT